MAGFCRLNSRVFALALAASVVLWTAVVAAAQTPASTARPSAAPAASPAASGATAVTPPATTPGAPAALPAMPAPTSTRAAAPAAAPLAAEVVGPARPSVKGYLTGNNVNIRKGPGTEYPTYATEPLGFEVQAVGQKGDWLEIEFPMRGTLYVSKEFVQKIDEKTGIVTKPGVNVRTGPGLQYDRAFTVPAGQKFQILGMDPKNEWFRVAPMPGETAWILAQYVKVAGEVPGSTTSLVETPPRTTGPEVTPRVVEKEAPKTTEQVEAEKAAEIFAQKLSEAEKMFTAEVSKTNPAEWNLADVEKAYTEVADGSPSPAQRVHARARLASLKLYAALQQRAITAGKVDEKLQADLKELEKQRAQTIMAIPGPLEAPFLAQGKVEAFYIKGLGGATHKLTGDGQILYLLRSDAVDLKALEGKTAGVRGKIVTVPGVTVRMIEVSEAKVLEGEATQPKAAEPKPVEKAPEPKAPEPKAAEPADEPQ